MGPALSATCPSPSLSLFSAGRTPPTSPLVVNEVVAIVAVLHARGDNLVVVGDPKQLPPTTFFQKMVSNDDDDDVVALEESESILDAVIPIFKNRRLRWHYRSRHESLIAFSNYRFYESNLILFPSPLKESDEFVEDIKTGHVKELEAAKVKS